MNIIKLSAIPSTNQYLKELSQTQELPNFTTVVTEHQTHGRGQMGTEWFSEKDKSLTFSVLMINRAQNITDVISLNPLVVTAIFNAFWYFNLTKVYVKWPNDILAEHKKIGGILIENSIKTNGMIYSIIGIGINISQSKHQQNLPNTGTIASIYGIEIHKDQLMIKIVEEMERLNKNFPNNATDLWDKYHQHLYRKDEESLFETPQGEQFKGIIKGVADNGQLQILHTDGQIISYGLKEIKLIY